MVHYKLYYFNVRGRAETIRMIFKAAGVDFEDYRFKEGEWATAKADAPLGQAPYIEVDGKKAGQSMAIARSLANKFGLAGKDDHEKFVCDAAVDTVNDLGIKIMGFKFVAKDEAHKEELKKEFVEKAVPTTLTAMNKHIGDRGHIAGDSLTWADIHIYNTFDFIKGMGLEISFADYPNVQKLLDNVANHPKIAAWIKERPVTNM